MIRHDHIIHETVNLLPAIVRDINLYVSSGSTEGNKKISTNDHSLIAHTTIMISKFNSKIDAVANNIINSIRDLIYAFDNCNLITTNETEYFQPIKFELSHMTLILIHTCSSRTLIDIICFFCWLLDIASLTKFKIFFGSRSSWLKFYYFNQNEKFYFHVLL